MPESGSKGLFDSMNSLSLVYSGNHGPVADPATPSFLLTDHGQFIDKNYDESLADLKNIIDYELVNFLLNLLKIDGPSSRTVFRRFRDSSSSRSRTCRSS